LEKLRRYLFCAEFFLHARRSQEDKACSAFPGRQGLPLRHAVHATSPKQGRSTFDLTVFFARYCANLRHIVLFEVMLNMVMRTLPLPSTCKLEACVTKGQRGRYPSRNTLASWKRALLKDSEDAISSSQNRAEATRLQKSTCKLEACVTKGQRGRYPSQS